MVEASRSPAAAQPPAVLTALSHLCRRPALSHRLGATLGELAWRIDGRHRRIAVRNLQTALPGVPLNSHRSTVRRCFRHFGEATATFLALGTLTAEEICSRTRLEGWENFNAVESNNGLLILTAHLGLHELLAPIVALYKGPMHMVARSFKRPRVERFVRSVRERFGNHALPKRGAVRGILRALAKGGRTVMLIDQRVHPNEGIEVPFFEQASTTSPLLAQLSLRTGAPVLPLFAISEGPGRYVVRARPAIVPRGSDGSVQELTARYMTVVEREIRRQPEQWLWMHDRWRRH